MTAENYPLSEFYKTDEVITQLGIGEALVTALNEKGIPTPLAACMMRAPMSRMDLLTQSEIDTINNNSKLVKKYQETIDRESAYEILNKKIETAQKAAAQEQQRKTEAKETQRSAPQKSSAMNPIVKVLTSATFIRGAFGILSKILNK